MNELSLEGFRNAIRKVHGAEAQLVERVGVDERFEGESVWQGEVLVFELQGHPEAERCYAWETEGRVTAVLGVGPVNSAAKAVRASILAAGESSAERGAEPRISKAGERFLRTLPGRKDRE